MIKKKKTLSNEENLSNPIKEITKKKFKANITHHGKRINVFPIRSRTK